MQFMDVSLQKTLTFLLFIGIGFLLKTKFNNKEEITGIKKLILNLALPATIFIALLGTELKKELLILPVFALLLNILLYFLFPVLLPLCGVRKNSAKYRTAWLLMSSLAPGLSSFPFILEYLGESFLAKAAMADLGNKVFVLIVLYVIAMSWHYKKFDTTGTSKGSRLKDLFKALITEPVNLFIAAALILLGFGLGMESLPIVISGSLSRLSLLMTPLVLLFIGLSVKINFQQVKEILGMLLLRAGLVIFASALLIWLTGITLAADRLLILAFSLSACSFWPFAHIVAVGSKELNRKSEKESTFNATYAVNILALSFPLSIILILGMFSIGEEIVYLPILFAISAGLFFLGTLPYLIQKMQQLLSSNDLEKTEVEIEPQFRNAEAEGA